MGASPKNYYKNNRDRLILKQRDYSHKLRDAIFEILGRKCCKCGFSDIRALQIDHINGGGSKERKSIGGRQLYKVVLEKLANGSKEYQILCANCNWIKRVENEENRKSIINNI